MKSQPSICTTVDPKPAAAIKVGYATRDLGLDYLEDGIGVLADKFIPQELIVIRSLIADISQLCVLEQIGLGKNDPGVIIAVDSQLTLVKHPALRDQLDRSSLATKSDYAIWYQLGAAWGEFANRSRKGERCTRATDCCIRFTEACRELSRTQPIAIVPCSDWIKYWDRKFEPQKILNQLLENLSRDKSQLLKNLRSPDPLRFLHLIIDAAEKLGEGVVRDGPVPPDKFAFNGVVYERLFPKPFRLVQVLWTARRRTADNAQLAKEVWGDAERELDNDDLGSARSKANSFFTENKIPYRIGLKDKCRYAILIDKREVGNSNDA